MTGRIYCSLKNDAGIAGLLRSIGNAAGLSVSLERPENSSTAAGRPCATARDAGKTHREMCRKTRLGILKRARATTSSVSAQCPVGGACFAAGVHTHGIHVATIKAGGFVHPGENLSARRAAVLDLLKMAADRVADQASSLIVATAKNSAPIDRACAFLTTHASERIGVAQVARQAGVGRQHLSRLWSKAFGKTIAESLSLARVENARHLLRCSGGNRKKIVDVAFESGFGSVSQFNRVFLKHTGMTPREFVRNSGAD